MDLTHQDFNFQKFLFQQKINQLNKNNQINQTNNQNNNQTNQNNNQSNNQESIDNEYIYDQQDDTILDQILVSQQRGRPEQISKEQALRQDSSILSSIQTNIISNE